jgi:peptidoglycan/LPS O-acetylase OafA/YrhL
LRIAGSGNAAAVMTSPPPPRAHAWLQILFAAVTALGCAGLLTAAALAPAPPAVLPLVILTCIGFPMAAASELPPAIAELRADRSLDRLRRSLDRLPEVEHPLGL